MLIAVAAVAGILAFGARLLSLAISRHREELADTSAVALVTPDGLRKALEKLEADHTVLHHVSRATAHLWIVAPLHDTGNDKRAKLNKMFDTHPPLAERIAILRKLEGLDPNERGPVDESITGVPIDLAALAASTDRRTSPPGASAGAGTSSMPGNSTMGSAAPLRAASPGPVPGTTPPGWYHHDGNTIRYWDGQSWTKFASTWNGSRWVRSEVE